MARKRPPVFARELFIFLILYIVLWQVVSIHAVHRDLCS
jgi:nitrate reductase NapE component